MLTHIKPVPPHTRWAVPKNRAALRLPPVLDPALRKQIERMIEEAQAEAEWLISVLDHYDGDADREDDGTAEVVNRAEYHPNVVTLAPRQE